MTLRGKEGERRKLTSPPLWLCSMWDQECPPPPQDLLLGDGVFTNASPDTTERQAHQVMTSKTVSSGIFRCWGKGQASRLDQVPQKVSDFPIHFASFFSHSISTDWKKPKGREEIP